MTLTIRETLYVRLYFYIYMIKELQIFILLLYLLYFYFITIQLIFTKVSNDERAKIGVCFWFLIKEVKIFLFEGR